MSAFTSTGYQIIRCNLAPNDILKAYEKINNSKDFEIGELSHIVIKETETIVGYIGDETLELYDIDNRELKGYHDKLKRIFSYIEDYKLNN